MKKLSYLLISFIAIITTFSFVNTVSAQQYGQYGQPSPSMTIMVNKMVGIPSATNTDPGSANYVDNLSPSDPRFGPNQLVFFKVQVQNTSNVQLDNVTLKDFLPGYLIPLQGPGVYDASTNAITYSIGSLTAGQEQDFFFKMQVKAQNQLPSDKGLFCFTNQAQAFNNNVSDSDTAQLCVEKQVATNVINVPSSGPEFGLVLLGLNLAGIGAGLALKKRLV